jgi:signal transduction histidine kinase
MSGTSGEQAQLRVSTRVLIQLGSELVTDIEQAILEAVKNAYDADSPDCTIEVNTRDQGVRSELGPARQLLRFTEPSENVTVQIYDKKGFRRGNDFPYSFSDNTEVERRLEYLGRITITDTGVGMSPKNLHESWLVISGSAKRVRAGLAKHKTNLGRTPLGDKGLGRLGTMKLGDILLVESATAPNQPIGAAQFRWRDCEIAATVDQVPVSLTISPNIEGFKGTRISVLGLREIPEWRRTGRGAEIAKSLAKLISPFESRATFPVNLTVDGQELSLASVTSEMLSRAVAVFEFQWTPITDQPCSSFQLQMHAKFRKELFAGGKSGKTKGYSDLIEDGPRAEEFKAYLRQYSRLRTCQVLVDGSAGASFVSLKRQVSWVDLLNDNGSKIENPGPFSGAFYYFNLDDLEAPDGVTVAGIGVDKKLIKEVSGISILRDGFRVRSPGDWLDISASMTSGSVYHMRVNNTVGYFALTGESNYMLTEKSDREGFVEDATYRGFLQIAKQCKTIANEAMEGARRGLDAFAKTKIDENTPRTATDSFVAIRQSLGASIDARADAERAVAELRDGLRSIQQKAVQTGSSEMPISETLERVGRAVSLLTTIQRKLDTKSHGEAALRQLTFEMESKNEQVAALFESAAVGLSARGLAHELRTHLVEIRRQTARLRTLSKRGISYEDAMPPIRAIRGSCSAIASAAALIDPMLPRSRAIKETMSVFQFISDYVANRSETFKKEQIDVRVSAVGPKLTVRTNRARLLQVIDNLTRNSVYWLRRGHITGQINRRKEISIVVNRDGFTFSDTGPGVAPEYEASLFELFVSGRADRDGGQGLGLFIITELLGVDGCGIALTSSRNPEGRRNTFEVNLRAVAVAS